jgi:LacI family transcriptional regulator
MTRGVRPTLKDVAERAGVSKSTVSRVINDDPYVGLEAHHAVTEAMAALGYRRNEVARSLRLQATGTIGLVVGNLRNEVFAAIAQGADRALSETGRMLLVGSSDGDLAREERVLEALVHRGVDGLIVSLADDQAPSARRVLRGAGVPVVLLDRDAHGVPADRVLSDHRRGITDAVADLRAHGHERIGLLAPPQRIRPGREVVAAFHATVGDDRYVRSGPLSDGFGREAGSELMALAERPSALIVTGIQPLAGVLATLEELHIAVPAQLSLVVYDDSAAARFHTPAISTLVRDPERMGALAGQLVVERIEGRRQPKKAIVPTQYEPRGSVVAPAGP